MWRSALAAATALSGLLSLVSAITPGVQDSFAEQAPNEETERGNPSFQARPDGLDLEVRIQVRVPHLAADP
jgi:hypothetical protein